MTSSCFVAAALTWQTLPGRLSKRRGKTPWAEGQQMRARLQVTRTRVEGTSYGPNCSNCEWNILQLRLKFITSTRTVYCIKVALRYNSLSTTANSLSPRQKQKTQLQELDFPNENKITTTKSLSPHRSISFYQKLYIIVRDWASSQRLRTRLAADWTEAYQRSSILIGQMRKKQFEVREWK